jgi:rhodanese-related sulfurtransferase
MSNDAFEVITVRNVKNRLDQGDALTLLDVREDHELAICALPGVFHIPLSQIPARLNEISTDKPVIVICHHGGRSAQAARYLTAKGLTDIHNMQGGVHAWATEIDPTMATY